MRWRETGLSTPNCLHRPSSRVAISSYAPSPRAETGLLSYVCGSVSLRRSYVLRAYFVGFPCTPSARMITFARKSIPGLNEPFIHPSSSTSTRRRAQGCPRAGRAPCLRSLGRSRRPSPPRATQLRWRKTRGARCSSVFPSVRRVLHPGEAGEGGEAFGRGRHGACERVAVCVLPSGRELVQRTRFDDGVEEGERAS
jgi:hypothetical protein